MATGLISQMATALGLSVLMVCSAFQARLSSSERAQEPMPAAGERRCRGTTP
jgi:hypothetical protein